VKDKEEAPVQSKMKWFAGLALTGGLLVGSLVATSVSAQTATPPGSPGGGFCPGYGMMGGGFGPGARVGAYGPGTDHESIAQALGITSQELWDARAAGKSVAELMHYGTTLLKADQVMDGIPEMIHEIQVEATFPDGTKLVTVHHPIV